MGSPRRLPLKRQQLSLQSSRGWKHSVLSRRDLKQSGWKSRDSKQSAWKNRGWKRSVWRSRGSKRSVWKSRGLKRSDWRSRDSSSFCSSSNSSCSSRAKQVIPQLALWQWARGEGGGARVLPGGVQHLWQEINTQERNQTQIREDDQIQNTVFLSQPVQGGASQIYFRSKTSK